MPVSWRGFVEGADDLSVENTSVVVDLQGGRGHRVSITDSAEGYVFEAIAASKRHVRSSPAPELSAWQRNRSSRLVGYRVDQRGRLVAHAWSPRVATTATMFQAIVRAVAREADRQELLMTGADLH